MPSADAVVLPPSSIVFKQVRVAAIELVRMPNELYAAEYARFRLVFAASASITDSPVTDTARSQTALRAQRRTVYERK